MKLRRHLCGAFLVIAVGAVWGCTLGSGAVRLASPGSVNIYRDVWGVPHVYAEREEDGFWGIGYTTAEDHLEGVLLRYLTMKGELASAFGPGPVGEQTGLRATGLPGREISDAVAQDRDARMFRHVADARLNLPKLPEQWQRNLESYIGGMESFMAEHPERVPSWAPTLEPALPLVISSWFMIIGAAGTCGPAIAEQTASLPRNGSEVGWDSEREVAAGPGADATALSGSNIWALPGERMAEKAAVFSSDSHGVAEDSYSTFLTPTRIHAGDLDAWLLDVPGAIMGIKGHSRHYAWGWSEGPRRPNDCVVLETMPGAPRTYLYDGSPVEMTVEPYVIEVAGEEAVRGEFEYTAHNGVMSPVVHRSGSTAYAVSSAYMARAGFAHVQFRDMLLATNDAEMEDALAQREIYPANLVYAGSDGSINYIRPGRIPIRPEGFDGVRPVDGNTSAGAWLGIRGLDEVLRLKRPSQSYLTNSNVSPDMMFGETVLLADDYPPDFAFQPGLTGTRQRRSIQLLEGDRVFTFEDAVDVVRDAFVVGTDLWGPVIAGALEDGVYDRADAEYRAFLDTLTAFDGYFVPQSRAALFHALLRTQLRSGESATAAAIESAINTGKPLTRAQQETLLEQAASAYAEVRDELGGPTSFGDVYRIGRGGTSEPARGFTLGSISGDRTTDLQSLWASFYTQPDEAGLRWSLGGSRHAFLVQLAPTIRSFSLASFGASDDPTSLHYSDQSHLFGPGQLHSNFFEPDELAESLSSTRTMKTRSGR